MERVSNSAALFLLVILMACGVAKEACYDLEVISPYFVLVNNMLDTVSKMPLEQVGCRMHAAAFLRTLVPSLSTRLSGRTQAVIVHSASLLHFFL